MRIIKKRYVYIALIALLPVFTIAKMSEKWTEEKIETVHEGNFALPLSQQPAPLFSFGQNLVDKGDLLAFIYPSKLKGPQSDFVEVVPSILYGLTNRMSLFIELPIAVKFKHEDTKSRGVSDLIVQLEQIMYAKETKTSVNEVTVVGHMTFPTGSASKEPATGFGSPTFFLGATLSRTTTEWYYFTSLGGQITTIHKHNKPGNAFLYQFGVGRNIAYKKDGWILNWMVEVNGIYRQRNIVCNLIDCNSGGNTLIIGPSIFFSTRRFEMDGGIAAVASQHLFGCQTKEHYVAAFYAGWKF